MPAAMATRHDDARARALVLLGAKGADNAQLRTLAAALPLDVRELALEFTAGRHLPNWFLPACPANLTAPVRAALAAEPVPDVVLSVGKRGYRAACAVKARSGGRTRWVHLGRPWGPLAPIDLVITTPQYGLAAGARVCRLPAPLTTIDVPARTAGADALLVVLVGGDSSTHRLDGARARALLQLARARAAALGAGLLFVTSRRTPAAVAALLAGARGDGVDVQLWNAPGADYRAALARASAFIVTTDSASMLTEAVLSGRPVQAFVTSPRTLRRWLTAAGRAWRALLGADRAERLLQWLTARGWLTPPRDMAALVTALRAFGVRNLELDEAPPADRPALDSLARARDAVRRLLALD